MGDTSTSSAIKLDHLIWGAGGLLLGTWWVKNRADEAKKSRGTG